MSSERFKLVEKNNHNAVHALFYGRESAEKFLKETVPLYVNKGYYMDKTLTPDSFEVIEVPQRPTFPPNDLERTYL